MLSFVSVFVMIKWIKIIKYFIYLKVIQNLIKSGLSVCG